jgi:iron(III) transport system substrate-binding protein
MILNFSMGLDETIWRIFKMRISLFGSALTLFANSTFAPAHAAPTSSVLNIYTTRHYETDTTLAQKFEQKTGIKVNTVQIKEPAQLLARVKEEKSNTQADLIITTDVGSLWRATDAELLQSFSSQKIEAAVPQEFRDKKNLWAGIAMRARLVAYNKTKIKPNEVANIEDLADSNLKGRVLVRSSNHIYNQSLAASLIATLGQEKLMAWAKGVTANLARKPQGGDTDQIKALAAGEGDVAIVNSYYAARLLESKNPADLDLMKNVAIAFTNQGNRGVHVNISGAGITKHAKNAKNAILFLEYLIEKESQQALVEGNKEYTVRKDVEAPVSLKMLGKPKIDFIGLSGVGKHTPDAVRILNESGWR